VGEINLQRTEQHCQSVLTLALFT